MCGILALLEQGLLSSQDIDKLKLSIDRRGPDYSSPILRYPAGDGRQLTISSSVLHLRGQLIEEQPVVDDQGCILMFNGELYKYKGEEINKSISDTIFLFNQLAKCETKDQVFDSLAAIDGPFAFVFFHATLNCLFFGRDLLGRKSLCILIKSEIELVPIVISSVCNTSLDVLKDEDLIWKEVDAKHLQCIDFSGKSQHITRAHWDLDQIYKPTSKCDRRVILPGDIILASRLLTPLNLCGKSWDEYEDSERLTRIRGLGDVLMAAVSRRLEYDNHTCLICRRNKSNHCQHSKVGVAFSGGIDSALLALLVSRVYNPSETIDLVNVAFKDGAPDRLAAMSAFRELRQICKSRNFRLILQDVPVDCLKAERQSHIKHLINPCKTVVDDSLGCGCWFIGQAKGRAIDSSLSDEMLESMIEDFCSFNPNWVSKSGNAGVYEKYTSPATIFFAGMGIDEQLGGYSSHRAAWKNGPGSLVDEISFQMRRLSSRNLGRDDRAFSDHGRELKLPFLDSDVISYLNDLPVGLKMNLDEGPHIGPKKILRLLSQHLGLTETSVRVKRALQFGSRIANLESQNEHGNEICPRL